MDEMLSQPFLTEEGFVNEACMKELESVIMNMPKTYERLKDDPEWNTKIYTSCRDIVGNFAHWAIRNIDSDVPFPPGLEKMVGYLYSCIRPKFDKHGFSELSLCDINKMLHDVLMEEKIFQSWNDEKVLPGWIDLDACLHNVCLSIRTERREDDRFKERYENKSS
jgi:hypothetical protein